MKASRGVVGKLPKCRVSYTENVNLDNTGQSVQ